jgi:NAD(P)-dependent dehydrogenase (short-subunit alcohol dehydrogenase family)
MTQFENKVGGIDYLVNNAAIYGGMKLDLLLTVPLDYYKKFMSVNHDGVLVCTRAVYKHMAKRGGGMKIRINAIAPGPIATEATRTVTPGVLVKHMVQQIPLSRMGTPEDRVGMCLFLLSDQACWITGQIFNIDGGQIIRS